jgi:uridine phosphorylase
MPIRIEPLTDPTPEAILVGDPRRAFALAQAFTDEPKMSHLARGLWGYVGRTPDGRGLTVQSTGSGGPAVAAVLSDLAEAGVETAVRMGTCESVEGGPEPGEVFLITEAIAFDGAGLAVSGERTDPADGPPSHEPDVELTERLRVELGDRVSPEKVSSHDLVARLDEKIDTETARAVIRDLQTSAFLATAARFGIRAAAILVVVESPAGDRLAEGEIEKSLIELWPGVAAALGKL